MTATIRSTDSRGSRAPRKPSVGSTTSKVTSITQRRRAKTGPVLPNYSAAEAVQALPRSEASTLKVLPNPRFQPAWLRSLLQVQRASSVAVMLILGGALSLYGLTVYSEQRWSQEYQKLETLRLREQQLSAASEVLKHQLAKEAENPETGLASQKPGEMIFLEPVPVGRSPQATTIPSPEPVRSGEGAVKTPLGY
ncbi:hypothetical protein [Tychonema sp. BBK16]|uniref:hypothetical protein n=1 Tax=Tychonema sp. BBK16 TaxID=2699888 RepID=UPI001F1D8AD4|nr:hypothetical protein [Tychonema sp. BBK16]MCF6372494.1 hypothetical protein [Tychonema sp. BBK16]